MTNIKPFLITIILFCVALSNAQVSSSSSNEEFALDPVKVSKFEAYAVWRHAMEPGGYAAWKASNPELYKKEMWYYTESFYMKRDSLSEGVSIDESAIDVSRFEHKRKPNVESVVILEGFKDVMILKPANNLLYKPN